MPAPGAILSAGFVIVWVAGLLVGIAYLRGGRQAVRLVLPRLAVIVPGAVLLFLAQQIVASKVGSITLGIVMLPVVYVTLFLLIRRYRHVRATAPDDVRASVAFTGAIRNFAIVWFIVGLVGSIVLAYLAARAGL